MRAPFLMSKALYLPSAQDQPAYWQLQACMLEFTQRERDAKYSHPAPKTTPGRHRDMVTITHPNKSNCYHVTDTLYQPDDSWGVFTTSERTRIHQHVLYMNKHTVPFVFWFTARTSPRVLLFICLNRTVHLIIVFCERIQSCDATLLRHHIITGSQWKNGPNEQPTVFNFNKFLISTVASQVSPVGLIKHSSLSAFNVD